MNTQLVENTVGGRGGGDKIVVTLYYSRVPYLNFNHICGVLGQLQIFLLISYKRFHSKKKNYGKNQKDYKRIHSLFIK